LIHSNSFPLVNPSDSYLPTTATTSSGVAAIAWPARIGRKHFPKALAIGGSPFWILDIRILEKTNKQTKNGTETSPGFPDQMPDYRGTLTTSGNGRRGVIGRWARGQLQSHEMFELKMFVTKLRIQI
jgi:hypothetical protein